MKCNNCINFDGFRCEAILDDDGDYIAPDENILSCRSFEVCIKKYRQYKKRNKNENF